MARDLPLIALAMASLIGCAATAPPAADTPAAPHDPLAAVHLPGAINAALETADDAPVVSLVGTDVLLDGKPAGSLRACYELAAQSDPTLAGGVTVAWQIDAQGAVNGAAVVATTLNDPKLEGCILRQMSSWRFPSSDAPTSVGSYPFRFGIKP